MPCSIRDESKIRIANYGTSNSGKLKELYRIGLSYRYGSMMQCVSGIHYNFSLADSTLAFLMPDFRLTPMSLLIEFTVPYTLPISLAFFALF